MTFADVAIEVAPSLLVAALGWYVESNRRAADRADTERGRQAEALTARLDKQDTDHAAALKERDVEIKKLDDRIHAQALLIADAVARAAHAAESTGSLREEVTDIRNNMVRRHDLDVMAEALGQRIDDAIRFVRKD